MSTDKRNGTNEELTLVQNTASAKKLIPNTITDEELNARLNEMMEKKLADMNANEVKLGITVQKLTLNQGKPKNDMNGNPVILPDGSQDKWSDVYFVDITFQGGKDTIRLTPSQVADFNIDPNKQYVAHGHIKLITPTEGKAYTTIEYTGFDRLF